MGRDWLSQFQINLSEVKLVEPNSPLGEVLDKYLEVFKDELGCVKDPPVKLMVHDQAKPKHRPVPLLLPEFYFRILLQSLTSESCFTVLLQSSTSESCFRVLLQSSTTAISCPVFHLGSLPCTSYSTRSRSGSGLQHRRRHSKLQKKPCKQILHSSITSLPNYSC